MQNHRAMRKRRKPAWAVPGRTVPTGRCLIAANYSHFLLLILLASFSAQAEQSHFTDLSKLQLAAASAAIDLAARAKAGDRDAQYQLGMNYLTGAGGSKDLDLAVQWLLKAARQGQPRAQFFIGQMYRSGLGVSRDLAEAKKWFRLAATWGDIDAQNAFNELRRRETKEKFQQTLDEAGSGDVQAQHRLAQWYLEGENGADKSATEAVKWLTLAAEKGHVPSQYRLGVLYKSGVAEIKADLNAARKWLDLAMQQGSVEARVLLKDISRQQQDDSIPLSQRFSNLQKHLPYQAQAEQGDTEAQYKLGMMYIRGEGVDRNPEKALHWLRSAARQHHLEAQIELGQLLMRGLYVDKDYAEAARWYEEAARAGDAEAQYNLGNMYRAGLGVDQDVGVADQWYSAAAKQGHAKARARLDPQ